MEFMNPEEESKLIEEFNRRFPFKVELHVHLDGAVRPETVLEIAKERGMTSMLPHKDVEELNRDLIIVEPCGLQRFLQSFGYFMPIITGCKNALSRIAYEICEDCARHRIKYAEVRYCPKLLEASGLPHENGPLNARDVVMTINEGLARGSKDFNISVKSILCIMTDKPEWAREILDLCKEFKKDGVVGIDMAGMEFKPGIPADSCAIKQVYQEAARCGIHRTVHAGEIGTSQAVQEALDDMLAERIGHGYHSYDDPVVYERVLKENVHLEVCPISSIMTRACDRDIQKHPLKQFVKDGINFGINTDDPVVLGNTLTDDYKTAQDMGLTDKDIIKGIFNAARSCFAEEEEKAKLLADLVEVYGEH